MVGSNYKSASSTTLEQLFEMIKIVTRSSISAIMPIATKSFTISLIFSELQIKYIFKIAHKITAVNLTVEIRRRMPRSLL